MSSYLIDILYQKCTTNLDCINDYLWYWYIFLKSTKYAWHLKYHRQHKMICWKWSVNWTKNQYWRLFSIVIQFTPSTYVDCWDSIHSKKQNFCKHTNLLSNFKCRPQVCNDIVEIDWPVLLWPLSSLWSTWTALGCTGVCTEERSAAEGSSPEMQNNNNNNNNNNKKVLFTICGEDLYTKLQHIIHEHKKRAQTNKLIYANICIYSTLLFKKFGFSNFCFLGGGGGE